MNNTISMLETSDIQSLSEPVVAVMPPNSNLKLRKSKSEKKYALYCRDNGKHTQLIYDDYRIIGNEKIVVRLGDTWYDVEPYTEFELDCLHLKKHGSFTQNDMEKCATIKLESLMQQYAMVALSMNITQEEKANQIRDIIDEICDRIGEGRLC